MIAIEKEIFNAERAAEVLPLARKCWTESTAFKGESCAYYGERDFAIEPDVEAYQKLQDSGKLVLVTLRDEGRLVGYTIGFIYTTLHHRKVTAGCGDSIYVEPEFRSHTWAIAKRFEKEIELLGAQIMGWAVHVNGPVYDVLKSKGYVADDVVMEKRLGGKLCV